MKKGDISPMLILIALVFLFMAVIIIYASYGEHIYDAINKKLTWWEAWG